ncbi:N-acetylmuramoyl-L-alanine amidase [Desulfobaculum xiamenense]|uniref:N-acetylmuramoyl-L-alanine amidase n=1 Tax=Desulfobaculum xiamenense TaxID=995050 RepID=A0A846QPG5_9BACT|nr:N-acetylmuramoyl-L-alanine amidase [Desulfobaculum xiamenense]NJB69067.1 N-acetylmuramoyl-L-alanine amidase [Desulfobaculum xiamenense]
MLHVMFATLSSRLGARALGRCVALVLAAALVLSLTGVAHAAGQREAFTDALARFKTVSDSQRLSQRKDMWLDAHARFLRVLNMDPNSPYAPKSLYYMARCHEELALKSWLKSDARRAVDAFQRAANRFPAGHSWVDDCLYRKAALAYGRLGDRAGAEADLKLILRNHAGGDQVAAARKLLAEIRGEGATSKAAPARDEKPAAPAAKVAPAAQKARPVPAKVRADYTAAVERHRALKADSKAGRDAFLRLARTFSELSAVRDAGTYAGRSAYFEGHTYVELGRRSQRKDDFQAAADAYQRAFDLFDPADSWRDDALYRKGHVEFAYLHDEDQAYADLLRVVREFADGDQRAAARRILDEMDSAGATSAPSAPAAAPVAVTPSGTSGGSGGVARLTDVRHSSGDDFTRVVLDIDHEVRFEDHTLPPDPQHAKSHRMFIDLHGTRLAPDLAARVDVKDGILSGVRAGQNDAQTARVVLDFQELNKYHLFTLENPFRIVIDVFGENGAAPSAPTAVAVAQPAPRRTPEPPHKPTAKDKQVAKDVLSQLGMTIQTIMIDAGHGGKDPGALDYETVKSGGKNKRRIRTKEKDVTLRLSRILGAKFEARGYRVLYTRTGDKKVQLEDRAMAANLKKADLFVSLHCNANHDASVRGFETYYLGKARNDIVLRLAAKENNVDPVRISDTQKIVMDLVHSFKIKESQVLAKHVQKNCVSTLRRKYKGVRDHGSRSAPFFVLIGARMPAILVETGYISNPTEAQWLRSDAYLDRVADGIVGGVEAYRKELAQVGP